MPINALLPGTPLAADRSVEVGARPPLSPPAAPDP